MSSRNHRRNLRLRALARQRGRCKYCKCPLTADLATLDHIWARSLGGGTAHRNAAAACRPCNRAKGNLPAHRFWELIDRGRPKPGTPADILLVWATRRIWKRTHQACRLIKSVAA